MNVLLDARETRRMSAGMRAYVRELAERLPRVAPEITLTQVVRGENFSFAEQIEIPLAARGADLVHFPTIFAPLILPRTYVLTIHDLIHLRHPELFSPATAAYYDLCVRRLARGAARILVGDARTIDDCVRFFGVHRDRVAVVPLGYDPELLQVPAWSGRAPYLIYVGNHRRHKNLATLIAAWDSLPADIEVDLALTGEDDLAPLRPQGGRKLVFLGNLSPAQTAGAMRGAVALVQPSLVEGYGLPVLEALVRQVPVIAAEDAAPGALTPFVARFAARDVGALRSLIEDVVRRPQVLRARAAEGEAIARAYTWDRFAARVASVYREALGEVQQR